MKSIDVQIKYFDEDVHCLKAIEKGDWTDVRVDSVKINGEVARWHQGRISYKAGDAVTIYLGFAMKMPEGFEAHIAPRGSTFKHFGLIQVNSIGIIDNTFCGDNDEWFVPFYALRDGEVNLYDRIAQMRLFEKCPTIVYRIVDKLEDEDRGSMGSTGIK